jgi:hypothetical protein
MHSSEFLEEILILSGAAYHPPIGYQQIVLLINGYLDKHKGFWLLHCMETVYHHHCVPGTGGLQISKTRLSSGLPFSKIPDLTSFPEMAPSFEHAVLLW